MRASSGMLRGCLGCLLALLVAPPAAAADARELLARMAEAMRTGAYEGTLVYQRPESIQTLSLAHAVIDGVVHERLSTLSGEPFEVIRVGEQVTCVWPGASEALVARRPEELLPTRRLGDLAELPDVYSAEIVGGERMAGRAADVIAIRPRDDSRYGYRMWIGREDRLLLRADLVGRGGAALERMVFTRVEPVAGLPAGRFTPGIDEARFAEHYATSRGAGVDDPPEWRPARLPAGFEPVSHREVAMPDGGAPVQHSVYSDGLASVSVFVEPADGGAVALDGLTYMGAVHAFGRRVGDRQVTVVGELPAHSVRSIAESVRRHGGG